MKKILSGIILCAVSVLTASADQAVVTFLGGKYTGDLATTDITPDDFALDKSFDIPGVGSFKVIRPADGKNSSQVKQADNPHLQFAINNDLTIDPKDVTLTKVEFFCTTKSYIKEVSASTGTATVDKDNLTITWEGSTTTPLTISNNIENAPIRIKYFIVTYTAGGSSAITEIAVDGNAPVRYYNLQGTEVTHPEKGDIYVRCEGTKAKKVIAE